MRKKYYFLLLMGLLLVFVAACNQETSSNENNEEAKETRLENLNESGMPIVNEPITLRFFAGKHANNLDDYNEVRLWQEYEKMTNITIDWELVPFDGLDERRNLALAGNENLPDAFYTPLMPNADLFKYGEQGTFLELTDLIEEHMPNLSSILDEYPEIRKGITFPDGGIYGFPLILSPEFESVHIGSKLWLRADWLEKLGMDIPETTDDFYEYLKAIKETDLNENGEADEIPYGAYRVVRLKEWLKGSFGLSNRGFKNGTIDIDPETDELRFYPIADESKQLLQYLNKLFEEELIAPNIYSIERQQNLAFGSQGLYGSTVEPHPASSFGPDSGDFIGVAPFEGPNGDRLASYVNAPISWLGGMIITKENEYPEATARWMDYFYGEEGRRMFFMGIEDESYEVTDDGEVRYKEIITNNPDGLTEPEARARFVTYGGGGYPGIVDQRYFQGSENMPESLEAMESIRPYLIDEVWPEFTYTEEELKVLSSSGADIEKYVEEMEDKFITGAASFDEWDDYVETLKGMGLDEYMEVKQAAYERYLNN